MTPKKILLAEDDVDDQMLFQNYLDHRTDIVLMGIAENGEEVVDMLEKLNGPDDLPDLVILDQNMPKRNGLQTLQILKESERYTHIPVAFYSTYADHQLISTCYQMGACAVVTKPLSKEGYNKMIDELMHVVNGKRS